MSGYVRMTDLLSLHENAKDDRRIAICQNDVAIVYFGDSISDQHVIRKDYFLLHHSVCAQDGGLLLHQMLVRSWSKIGLRGYQRQSV